LPAGVFSALLPIVCQRYVQALNETMIAHVCLVLLAIHCRLHEASISREKLLSFRSIIDFP
jgi:hypothetical protein